MIASFADPGRRPPASVRPRPRPAGRRTPQIVGLSADLAKYTDMHIFRDAPGSVLPDRHGRTGHARRRHGRSGPSAVRVHVRGVRHPTRVRLCASTCRAGAQRQCRRRAARPDHRIRPQPPGHRGPGHTARHAEPDHRGPLYSVDIEQAVPALAAHPGPTTCGCLRGKVPTVLDEYDYHFELQGCRAAHRPRRGTHLHRVDDHAG